MGNGVGWRLLTQAAPEKLLIFRHLPIVGKIFRLGRRELIGLLVWKLRMIHPNPGPGGRNQSEEGKAARKGRKRLRRKAKREERARAKISKIREIIVIAWNVQRMSLVSREKRKARVVAEYTK